MSDERPVRPFSFVCALPISDYPRVQLAHGGGGRLTQMLVDGMFVEAGRVSVENGRGTVRERDGNRDRDRY